MKLDVRVGDRVTIVHSYQNRRRENSSSEEVIVRVGRLYAYIEVYGKQLGYSLENGWAKSGEYGGRMFTPESYAAHQRLTAAITRLRDLTRHYPWFERLPLEKIEAIVAILESDS